MQDSEAAVSKLRKLLQALRRHKLEVVKCPPARITCGVCMHVLVYSFASWSVFFKG